MIEGLTLTARPRTFNRYSSSVRWRSTYGVVASALSSKLLLIKKPSANGRLLFCLATGLEF